jgi:hypothetical protein
LNLVEKKFDSRALVQCVGILKMLITKNIMKKKIKILKTSKSAPRIGLIGEKKKFKKISSNCTFKGKWLTGCLMKLFKIHQQPVPLKGLCHLDF